MNRLAALLITVVSLLVPAAASAHPLGNFTVNQYARVEVAPDRVGVFFVLDQAEIPTFKLVQRYDADGDGTIAGAELTAARDALVGEIAPKLRLTVDGTPAPLSRESATLAFPTGQAGLRTTRLELHLRATGAVVDARTTIGYSTTFATDRIGWREVVVARAAGAAIESASTGTVDRTNALRSYPKDLLTSPLDVTTATFVARPGDGGLGVASVKTDGNVASAKAGKDASGFAALLDSTQHLSLGVALLALLLAMGWGAIHALSPGHGKTMVAAYLAGTRGSARHAFALGATVTITHTSSVFLLGFVTLSLSQFILPEDLFPWLNLVSGLMVLSLGGFAIRDRLRRRRATGSVAAHDHSHSHDHGHAHDHGHSHAAPSDLSWRSLIALGISGGIIPCPSALVVLLSAIAIHRVAFGMLLIVAFSFGLAAVISGIGLAVLYARRLFARVPSSGRFVDALPVVSALVITVLGVVLTVRALPGIG